MFIHLAKSYEINVNFDKHICPNLENKRRLQETAKMSKLQRPAMSLKQFMLRQEVLKLYRSFLRSIRTIPDQNSQIELRDWVRVDFKNNKHHKDEIVIKMMIQSGKRQLNQLEVNLGLSGLKREK